MRGFNRAGHLRNVTSTFTSAITRRMVPLTTAVLAAASLSVIAPTATGVAAAADPECGLSAKLVPSCGVLTGVSTYKGPGETWEQSLVSHETRTGITTDVLHHYHDWNDTFPSTAEKARAAQGQKLLITWIGELDGGTVLKWADIAAGKQDAIIDSQAQAVKAFGQPIFVNFQNEPEAFVGQRGTSADFVAAWRRIHDRFKAAGVTNAIWTLVYMGVPESSTFMERTAALYPGDDYVDWIGWDPYNRGACNNQPWKSFQETVKPFYDWLMLNGHSDKPFMLAEYASVEDPTKPNARAEWFDKAADSLVNYEFPNLKLVSYFDHPAPPATCDWRVETSAAATTAYANFTNRMKTYSTTPVSTPTAPRSVVATSTAGSAVINWQPPASNGAGAITEYTVTASPGGAKVTVPGPAPITTAAITGLTPGVNYTFTVTATNSAGVGNPATSAAITPRTSTLPVTDVTAGGWKVNGKAVVADGGLRLTDDVTKEIRGTAWWPTAVNNPSSIAVTFDSTMDGGLGADGTALMFGDVAAGAKSTSIGNAGGGLGWSGIPGFAVALDTYKNGTDPSNNFIGVASGWEAANPRNLVWNAAKTQLLTVRGTHRIAVVISGGKAYVTLDGVQQMVTPVNVPSSTLIGFGAGQGGRTDRHLVTNVKVSAS